MDQIVFTGIHAGSFALGALLAAVVTVEVMTRRFNRQIREHKAKRVERSRCERGHFVRGTGCAVCERMDKR